MDTYMDQDLYQEGLKIYKQIIDFQDRQNLNENFFGKDCLSKSVVLQIRTKQYNEAEGMLRMIIEKLRNQRRHYFSYFVCLNNLAVILLNTEKLTEAKTILNDALEISSELYGENAVHPYFARCLINQP
jgi:tetratricopeptide (TPR) repeat protein